MSSVLGVVDFNNGIDNMRQFFSVEECRRKICITNHAMFICRYGEKTDGNIGVMPFVFNDKLYAVSYLGEITNAEHLRNELTAYGVEPLCGSIEEIIAAAYSIFGMDCAGKLKESFVCSVYDAQNENLFLMRSPDSEKEIYYTVCDGTVMFSTEYEDVSEYAKEKFFCGPKSAVCSVREKGCITFDKSGIIAKKDD